MKYLLILLVMLLSGCIGRESWRDASLDYECTEEQHSKLMKETQFCIDNIAYHSTYCYGSSIIRNCKKVETINEH